VLKQLRLSFFAPQPREPPFYPSERASATGTRPAQGHERMLVAQVAGNHRRTIVRAASVRERLRSGILRLVEFAALGELLGAPTRRRRHGLVNHFLLCLLMGGPGR
jgi:hypothetical protein